MFLLLFGDDVCVCFVFAALFCVFVSFNGFFLIEKEELPVEWGNSFEVVESIVVSSLFLCFFLDYLDLIDLNKIFFVRNSLSFFDN